MAAMNPSQGMLLSILVNVEKLMKLPMEAEGVMLSRAQVAAMIRSPTEME